MEDMNLEAMNFTKGDPPGLVETTAVWTQTLGGYNYSTWYPTIAAYDGAVVCACEYRNDTGPLFQIYLNIWYNNLYNGSVWGNFTLDQGFMGRYLWGEHDNSIQFLKPVVHHYEGRTFYMTFIEKKGATETMCIAVSYDGGAEWGSSPGQLQYYSFADPLHNEKRFSALSENVIAYETPTTKGINITSGYLTSVIQGYVHEVGNPSAGATVDIYNLNSTSTNGYKQRLAPVTTDATGFFKKKVLSGIEIADNEPLKIIAGKNAGHYVGFYDALYDPLDYVNDLNTTGILLNQYYQDITGCPFYWAYDLDTDTKTDTGAAVAQMILNYIWWNQSAFPTYTPKTFADQNALKTAFDLNTNGINASEMLKGLNDRLPSPKTKYGYFFDLYVNRSNEPVTAQLKRLAVWLNYQVDYFNVNHTVIWPSRGYPLSVPEAVPFNGNWNNWTVVRGMYTDVNPWDQEEGAWQIRTGAVTVKGVWVNQPYLDTSEAANYYGLPGKTYMTTATFLTKYLPINLPGDTYNKRYVAIVDPVPGLDQNSDIGAPAIIGVEKAQFTPGFAKLAANGLINKAIGAAAQHAVANILRNNIQNFNVAGQLEHSIISQVVKTNFGYRVTLKTQSSGTYSVDLDKLATLLSFTNI